LFEVIRSPYVWEERKWVIQKDIIIKNTK
jgi:hypothetical protein